MIKTLNLELTADTIDPLAPLFRDGLGLNSIDILELALAISQTYSVQLRADNDDNEAIFRSLRSLNDHIQRHRPASRTVSALGNPRRRGAGRPRACWGATGCHLALAMRLGTAISGTLIATQAVLIAWIASSSLPGAGSA